MKTIRVVCALAVVMIARGASAYADTTIDFEARGVGAPVAVTSAQDLIFAVSGNFVQIVGGQVVKGNPFFGGDTTAIYATASSVCIGCQMEIHISFEVPVNNVSLLLLTPLNSQGVYTLFDDNGDATSGFGGTLSLPLDNISTLILEAPFVLTNGVPTWAFAMDNLTFTTPTVPEPGSLLLVVSGVGALLSASRKRANKQSS